MVILLFVIVFALIGLAGVITFVFHIGDVTAFAEQVSRARPSWLLLAVGALGAVLGTANGWITTNCTFPGQRWLLSMPDCWRLMASGSRPSSSQKRSTPRRKTGFRLDRK